MIPRPGPRLTRLSPDYFFIFISWFVFISFVAEQCAGTREGCNLTFMNIFIEKSEVSLLETVFLLPRRERKKSIENVCKIHSNSNGGQSGLDKNSERKSDQIAEKCCTISLHPHISA